LEIRVGAGYRTVDDINEMIALMSAEFARSTALDHLVIAADWRQCRVLTPEVAERAVLMLSRSNPRVKRSAILHAREQSTSVLQVMRLAREAKLPHRRVFTETAEMRGWLEPVLNAEELARLDLLLRAPTSA